MTHLLTSVEALETLYGPATERSLWKEIDFLNADYQAFVTASPFVVLATVGPGGTDCSPKGDAPGFVRLLDEKTLATISNLFWNRRLTWRDRRQGASPSALLLFGKYVAAAGLSIVLQSLLTKWLALHMHYILANIAAIALASVCNFVANDRLTFRRSKPP